MTKELESAANKSDGAAPGIASARTVPGQPSAGRLHEGLVLSVIYGRIEHDREEQGHRANGQRLGPFARPRRKPRDEEGKPHMRAAVDGDCGAEHREPEKQDPGELVGPNYHRPCENSGP